MPKSPVFWKMRNGQLIDIDKMDIEHLRNTLKMLVRNNSRQKPRPSSILNGEMAQFFNDSYLGEDQCDATEIDLY